MGDNDINQYSTASQRLFANLVWRLRYEAAAMYSGLSSLLKSPSVACLRRLQQTRQSAVYLYPWIRALACSLHLQAGQCGKLKLELHAFFPRSRSCPSERRPGTMKTARHVGAEFIRQMTNNGL